MKSTRIALAAASAFLLAACGFGGGESSDDESPAAKRTGEVIAVVDTSKSECHPETAKEDGNCWLPLYAGSGSSTRVANLGGACTREDERKCWPQPGERLTVVCGEPGGEELQDATGSRSLTRVWLGVAIPKDRVLAKNYTPELDSKGRAVVFASSLWLKPTSTDRFPACEQFFVSTNAV